MKVSKIIENYNPSTITFWVEKNNKVTATIFFQDHKGKHRRINKKYQSLEVDVKGFKRSKYDRDFMTESKQCTLALYYSEGIDKFYMNLYYK